MWDWGIAVRSLDTAVAQPRFKTLDEGARSPQLRREWTKDNCSDGHESMNEDPFYHQFLLIYLVSTSGSEQYPTSAL
jgi:hypothetical protein